MSRISGNRLSLAAIIFLPVLLLSCTPLSIYYPRTSEFDFIDEGFLPSGIRRTAEPAEAVWTLDISRVLADNPPPGARSMDFLVPSLVWNDSRISVASSNLVQEGIELVSLSEMELPRKLIAVDGLYPGDDGYPLFEWGVPSIGSGGRNNDIAPRRKDRGESILQNYLLNLPGLTEASAEAPEIYRISAVGDIMPGRGFGAALAEPGAVSDVLGDVAALLAAPDLLIGNLETAVTDSTDEVEKSYNFKVSPAVLDALVNLGFDFFHLANNHGWDYGERGFLDTLDAVEKTGVGFSGAGTNLENARFAWETESTDGSLVRILSLGAYFTERNGFDGASAAAAGEGKPGVLWDSPENEAFIRSALGQGGAFTIVTVHGGYEWEEKPRNDVMEMFRRYVDWGADLVIAHHPHVLQGMEVYQGAVIAYSLGNFIFPGMTGWYTGEETGVLELLLYDGRIVGLDFQPVRIEDIRLRRADDEDIAERFWNLSRESEAGAP